MTKDTASASRPRRSRSKLGRTQRHSPRREKRRASPTSVLLRRIAWDCTVAVGSLGNVGPPPATICQASTTVVAGPRRSRSSSHNIADQWSGAAMRPGHPGLLLVGQGGMSMRGTVPWTGSKTGPGSGSRVALRLEAWWAARNAGVTARCRPTASGRGWRTRNQVGSSHPRLRLGPRTRRSA